MKHILICDDEPQVLLALEEAINHVREEEYLINTFTSRSELIDFLCCQRKEEQFILFLDIVLGNESSIPVSARILKYMPNLRVIYVTGHLECCEDIFFTSPSGFLVKPVKEERLAFLLRKVSQELDQLANHKLSVFSRSGKLEEIPVAEILYLESAGRIVRIHTLHTAVECYRKLDDLALLLPDFLRPHKSYLVNCAYLQSSKRLELTLSNGKRIPVAKTRAKVVRDYLTSLDQNVFLTGEPLPPPEKIKQNIFY